MLRLLPFRLAAAAIPTLFAASVLGGQASPSAPAPDRWQLTLTDQSYIWNVRLVRLAGDTLTVRAHDSLVATPIQNITEIQLLPETILRVGDGHRSGIGALADNNSPVLDLAPLAVPDRRRAIQALLDYEASAK